jgi:inhibitor of KinA sporulation pathway (predicted exonuclease)
MNRLIVDLEATCAEDGSIPTQEMETIQIGAAVCDAFGVIVDYDMCYVKPVRHPILSTFCTQLTGITQDLVDKAATFPVAFEKFLDGIPRRFSSQLWSRRGVEWYSWGCFDKHQLERDSIFHGCRNPMGLHHDLAAVFRKLTGKKRGHRGAMQHFGLSPVGRAHDGLVDAKNMCQLIPLLYPSCDNK